MLYIQISLLWLACELIYNACIGGRQIFRINTSC